MYEYTLAVNSFLELSALSSLPYLTHLNVSHNKLTSVLDFDPPKNLLVMQICICTCRKLLLASILVPLVKLPERSDACEEGEEGVLM